MKISLISYIYNADNLIENYIYNITNLVDIDNHEIIICNIYNSNSINTNNIIKNFKKSKQNIKLIKQSIKKNKINIINQIIKNISTDFFYIYDIENNLDKNFIYDYTNYLNNNKKTNILFSPIKLSNKLNNLYNINVLNKKKIFFEKNKENKIIDYKSKNNLLIECLKNNIETDSTLIDIDNSIDIFDFFFIKNNNYIDLNNYNLYHFIESSAIIKTNIFKKFEYFDQSLKDLSFFDFFIRLINKEIKFNLINKVYITNKKRIIDSDYQKNSRKIIKKYHPIFNYINSNLDILIPYRNRTVELNTFIDNIKKILNIYFEYNIFICNQDDNKYFKRSIINIGVSISKNKKIWISDVDIIFKKIPIQIILLNNNSNYKKIYGLKKNKLSLGGGSLIVSYDKFISHNGFSSKYVGWGSEDIDFIYRSYFENIGIDYKNSYYREDNNKDIYEFSNIKINDKEKKNMMNYNNNLLIQQIINYNIIFYLKNKLLFKKINSNIYFNKNIFMKIKEYKNYNYIYLYDIVSSDFKFPTIFNNKKNILIYSGMIINNFPNGMGSGWNLWGNKSYELTGIWKNGYLKKKLNNKYKNDDEFKKICQLNAKLFNKDFNYDLNKNKKNIYSGYDEMIKNYNYNIINISSNIIKINIKT